MNIYGSYEQPKTKFTNSALSCKCSLSKNHDFAFSVEADNHSKYIQWKLEHDREVKNLHLWSSYFENGVESSCGPVHSMKIDTISLEVSIAGVFLSITIISVGIFVW